MSFTPEQTQRIVVSSSLLVRLVGFGFCAWIAIVGWVGKSVIDRVDILTNSFNSYVLTMERRVTALEESQREQNHILQDLKDDRRK